MNQLQAFTGISGSSPRDLQRQDAEYPRVTDSLFNSCYWSLNGEGIEDFSLITDGNEAIVYFRAYQTRTYVGMIWTSVDTWSHGGLAYDDYLDYTGVVWTFDLEVSATCPVINSPSKKITLDIKTNDGNTIFVELADYAVSPGTRNSRITLDFDDLRGAYLGGPTGSLIDPTKITSITLGCISDSYDISIDNEMLSVPDDCWYKITTVSVVGGAAFTVASASVAPHNIGMATAYDNMHVISPERVVATMKALGYNGKINHYCGVSQYPNKTITGGNQVIVEGVDSAVNLPCVKWHTDYAERCKVESWGLIFSISYEMYSPFAKIEYAQRDRDGTLGSTGYSPTSYLLIPTSTNGAMTYLGNVFETFANIMNDAAIPVVMQIGEPWWWWNSDNSQPCTYDSDTLNKFNADTGLFAPTLDVFDLSNVDMSNTGPIDIVNDTLEETFIKWCRKELGESTLYLRDRVKTAYPSCEIAPLLFIPSLFNEGVGIISLMNFPQEQFKSPNFDFFMTEAYDDVINGKYTKAERAMAIPISVLGYPADKVHYLAGFVPNAELAEAFDWTITSDKYTGELWSKITGNMRLNEKFNIARQYIWSYPQIAEDSFIYKEGTWSTVLDRRLIRPVEAERVARYIDFSSTPVEPVEPVEPENPERIPAVYKPYDSIVSFTFAGSMRVEAGGESSSNFATGTMGFNAARNSLYMEGFEEQGGAIAEFEIPATLSMETDPSLIPLSTVLQPYKKMIEGEYNNINTGMLVIGNNLIVNTERWYDGDGSNTQTTYVVEADDIGTRVNGYGKMDGLSQAAGYMGEIPLEHQAALGGAYYTGWASNWSVTNRYSQGPSFWVFDPADAIAAGQGVRIPATAKMNFPHGEGTEMVVDGDEYLFNVKAEWNPLCKAKVSFILGDYVFFIGANGGIDSGIGYKLPRSDGSLCNGQCPYDEDDFHQFMWVFSIADIVAATNPWDVRAIAFDKLHLPIDAQIKGGAWDAANSRVYLSLEKAGQVGAYDAAPLVVAMDVKLKTALHIIGDSFVTYNFVHGVTANIGGRYSEVSSDGVGATSLAQQKIRFDSTPEYYDSTLLIMDGGLDDTASEAIAAIDAMVAKLTHDRWVWVQPSPSSWVLGSSERTYNDSQWDLVIAHVGVDHYVECLPQLQALNDGSVDDLQDVADGLVPRSLRYDFIHENEAGTAARAEIVSDFIEAKGW